MLIWDMPQGKAMTPVETSIKRNRKRKCTSGCFLYDEINKRCAYPEISCMAENRSDGKDVIFKLIDCQKIGLTADVS